MEQPALILHTNYSAQARPCPHVTPEDTLPEKERGESATGPVM